MRVTRRKVHVGINVNSRIAIISPLYTPQRLIELAEEVEELGMDSVWTGDSFIARPRLEPITTLAAIASKTTRVRLGTACLTFPWKNPLLLAQQWATLDLLSGGRTILGVGTGLGSPLISIEKEYESLGVPFKERTALLEEGITILKRLWTETDVSFSGETRSFEGVTLEPKPLQKPHPPIYLVAWPYKWRGVTGMQRVREELSNRMIERIAKYADGWMVDGGTTPTLWKDCYDKVKDAATKIGRNSKEIATSIQFTGNIGDNSAEALVDGEEYLTNYYFTPQKGKIEFFETHGTADDWLKRMDEYISLGMQTFILRFSSFNQFAQVERFAKQVFPSL
jgi:alkanesulfonate monooxygenase SsuD/methylene tetrahydromethanopterin reductase-like flavin-dependent oxidoreductase (luciferase family)